MDPFIIPAAQLGGTVFVTVAFLWYLTKRDDKWSRSIDRLTDVIERNIISVDRNVPAVKENTGAVKENTDVVKVSNGNKH